MMGIQDRDYYWRKSGRREPRFKKVNGAWVRVEKNNRPRIKRLNNKATIKLVVVGILVIGALFFAVLSYLGYS